MEKVARNGPGAIASGAEAGLGQPVFDGEGGGFRAVCGSGLGEYALDVVGYGVRRDEQLVCDVTIA